MAFTLRIKCHGIIGYVENEDADHVALLLCKAERRQVRDQQAYVRFPKAALEKTLRKIEPRVPGAPRDQRHIRLGANG